MPNWAKSEMSIVLPTKNVKKFKNLFLSSSETDNCEKKHYFARCYMKSCESESNKHGLSRLYIQFDAAWSIYSCMISGYPEESHGICPTLESVCKKLNVQRLIAYSEEGGMCFEESILYTPQQGLTCECRDLYEKPCNDYLDEDENILETEGAME